MSDEPLMISDELLVRVARIAEPHHHALIEAIRAAFDDTEAPSMFTLAVFMWAGDILKNIPNADRAPDGIALLWSIMGVPFTVQAKQVQ